MFPWASSVSILCTLDDISPIHRFYRIHGCLEDIEVYYINIIEEECDGYILNRIHFTFLIYLPSILNLRYRHIEKDKLGSKDSTAQASVGFGIQKQKRKRRKEMCASNIIILKVWHLCLFHFFPAFTVTFEIMVLFAKSKVWKIPSDNCRMQAV